MVAFLPSHLSHAGVSQPGTGRIAFLAASVIDCLPRGEISVSSALAQQGFGDLAMGTASLRLVISLVPGQLQPL